MNVHFIAIGGSAMHALALALYNNHYAVTGSDDEIYDPARSKLAEKGLLPKQMGWHPERIHDKLDFVILGMHAKPDNPELLKAQALGLKILSYPAFIAKMATDKQRIVIGGSHGKTTTTALILHVLRTLEIPTDYLVGAQLPGFDSMVQLSDAPIIVLEGDEYLSSPLDKRPKFLHYEPHIAVLTGISWDHINVFPTFESYCSQFENFIQTISNQTIATQGGVDDGALIYYQQDEHLQKIIHTRQDITLIPYAGFECSVEDGQSLIHWQEQKIPTSLVGAHNMQNLHAAFHVCRLCGIEPTDFFQAIQTFEGAAKRLELLAETESTKVYLDFAHAPSKVKATIDGLAAQFPQHRILAILELHTYSSLNQKFLPQYAGTLENVSEAFVCYDKHTLEMKRLPPLDEEVLNTIFSNNAQFGNPSEIAAWLDERDIQNAIVVFMSSGSFGGFDVKAFAATVQSDSKKLVG